MSDPVVIIAVTIGLIMASAFFVAVEFALIAARKHRLEDAAATSRSARAALRSTTELSLLLAGAQLGITACTLALGAITKPAVHHWITPVLHSWGAPSWTADAGGFVLALLIVTFLHLVLGEMAPKSWAIAHPERSATMLALPMRGFMALTRPLLLTLNRAANWCLRRVGVTPVDEVETGQNPDALRHLVEHSATLGTLDERYHANLISALELEKLTVGDITDSAPLRGVPLDADVAQIHRRSTETGHLRLLVFGADGAVAGVVHVRDSVRAAPGATAGDLMRQVLTVPAETPVYQALQTMRETRTHLWLVTHGGAVSGVLTVGDVLNRLLPVAA